MILDQRSAFTLGVGYGPLPMAMLGLWPVEAGEPAVPPAPTFSGITLLLPKYKPTKHKPGRPIEEDEALFLAVLH